MHKYLYLQFCYYAVYSYDYDYPSYCEYFHFVVKLMFFFYHYYCSFFPISSESIDPSFVYQNQTT